ncbi:hypothetical protein GCWU000325_02141 [Alloprevotella tannerae ATCC 51259]|uniref:Uncharacterized protein n=1 Tax=Alloprevotella tannerae ATCC 51259 TaxID=626522 RepID=C9LIT1_9BACT|nr:hypothetical protein GCWU000325_02141 [Alloprevotella tannerae ATCC 51259]
MHLFNLPLLLAYLPTSAVPRSTVFGIRILYSLLLPHLIQAGGGAKCCFAIWFFMPTMPFGDCLVPPNYCLLPPNYCLPRPNHRLPAPNDTRP